jgi:hypothetical protein
MYEYHDNYKKAKGDADAQGKDSPGLIKEYHLCDVFAGRWARQLTWEIARHAVGEEIVVYPLMEKLLGKEGLELADHDRAEHQVLSIAFSFCDKAGVHCQADSKRTTIAP